jgi:hypothetical protein
MNWNRKSIFPQARFLFDGVEYRWAGWLGCQLESLELRTPPAGTARTLDFGNGKPPIDVTVYSTAREGLKCRATWSVRKSGTHDEYVQRIEELRGALRALV